MHSIYRSCAEFTRQRRPPSGLCASCSYLFKRKSRPSELIHIWYHFELGWTPIRSDGRKIINGVYQIPSYLRCRTMQHVAPVLGVLTGAAGQWDVYVFCLSSEKQRVLTRARGIDVVSSSVRYMRSCRRLPGAGLLVVVVGVLRFDTLKLSCTVSMVHVDFGGNVYVHRWGYTLLLALMITLTLIHRCRCQLLPPFLR